MAGRRMFSRDICREDRFLDLPVSARELYFQLGLEADDEGFVGNPRSVQRIVGAIADDMEVLAGKGYIIPFDSGVIVITHWAINNYIKPDRKHATSHLEEKRLLNTDESDVYGLKSRTCLQDDSKVVPKRIQGGSKMPPEVSKEVGRLGKEVISDDEFSIYDLEGKL